MASWNGFTIVPLPAYPPAPKSVEYTQVDIIGASVSPFTGQMQMYDWQNARHEWSVEWPLITPANEPAWRSFLAQLRGNLNVFQIGDPLHLSPAGTALGTPVVNGASQSGFTLATRGWTASQSGLLLPGDWLQVGGLRLHTVLAPVNSDGSGDAIVQIWPNLRDGGPADGSAVVLNNTTGLFRLKDPMRKMLTRVENAHYYSLQLDIREAL